MKKRTRRKKTNRRPNRRTLQGDLFIREHPLSRLPREEYIPGLIEAAKASSVAFQENLKTTLELLSTTEPLDVISACTLYGCFAGVSFDGKVKPLTRDERFGQAGAELAQALCLTIPYENYDRTPLDPSTFEVIFELIAELCEDFARQRMIQMERERSDKEKTVTLVQELLRLNTQAVRNWGYLDSVIRIAQELLEPLNCGFSAALGLSATQVISVFVRLKEQIEDRAHAWRSKLAYVLSARTPERMVRRYYEVNPHFKNSANEMIEAIKPYDLNQVKASIVSHASLSLPDIFKFDAVAVAGDLEIPSPAVERVLAKLSIAFGDLALIQPDSLLLHNPVWLKPLIKLGGSSFLCALPQAFFSFVFPVISSLIASDQPLMQSYEARRSMFLEMEIVRLFSEAFPRAEIVSSFRWRDGAHEYENDLLVRIDSHLLLVEAKSGAISWPALRGAPERAKRHIKELFYEPSVQSARLADRISAAINNPELRDALLPNLSLRLDLVRTILRLSVTLETFAAIQANTRIIKDAGWIPDTHKLAPCVTLANLQDIFHILESAGQKLHYLRRRKEFEERANYLGDEMDILGFYLATGFNIEGTEIEGGNIQLTGTSSRVDEYFVARAMEIKRSKPRLRLSRWWTDICTKIEGKDFYQWTDASNILLSIALQAQEDAYRVFKDLAKHVRRWGAGPHDGALLVPPKTKSDAVALHAFSERQEHARHDRMNELASQAFAHDHVEICLVLALDVASKSYPYRSLAVFFKGETLRRDVVVY